MSFEPIRDEPELEPEKEALKESLDAVLEEIHEKLSDRVIMVNEVCGLLETFIEANSAALSALPLEKALASHHLAQLLNRFKLSISLVSDNERYLTGIEHALIAASLYPDDPKWKESKADAYRLAGNFHFRLGQHLIQLYTPSQDRYREAQAQLRLAASYFDLAEATQPSRQDHEILTQNKNLFYLALIACGLGQFEMAQAYLRPLLASDFAKEALPFYSHANAVLKEIEQEKPSVSEETLRDARLERSFSEWTSPDDW